MMTPKPACVRYATPADEDGIIALGKLLADENGMFEMDEERVRFAVRRAINYDRTICGVIGPSEAPEGVILLFIGEPWYAKRQVLEELCNFVHPDHRKKKHAIELLNFAKHVSDDLGIILHIGIISNVRTEAKVRLYQRNLQYVGAFFTHNQHLEGRVNEWVQPIKTKLSSGERRKRSREREQARLSNSTQLKTE